MKIKPNKSNCGIFFSRKQNETLPYKSPTELALMYLLEFEQVITGYWSINRLMPYLPALDAMARTSLFIASDFNANQKVILLEDTKAIFNVKAKFIKNKIEEYCRLKGIRLLVFNENTIQHGKLVENLRNLYRHSDTEIPVTDLFAIDSLFETYNFTSISEIKQQISAEQVISPLLFHRILKADLANELINDEMVIQPGDGFEDFVEKIKKQQAYHSVVN